MIANGRAAATLAALKQLVEPQDCEMLKDYVIRCQKLGIITALEAYSIYLGPDCIWVNGEFKPDFAL